MKISKILIITIATIMGFNVQAQIFHNNGIESSVRMVYEDVDDNPGEESFVVINPDDRYSDNRMVLNEKGALVIGESSPCELVNLLPGDSPSPMLYVVTGSAVNKEGMWSTPLPHNTVVNARMAGPMDNNTSMSIVNEMQVYPKGGGNEVFIGMEEAKQVLPGSVGRIQHDGQIYDTFNGSQLFNHAIGAINYLKEENEVLKSENELLREMLEDLSARVTNLENGEIDPRDESSKIVNIYPNPTNNVVRIEFEIQEIINYAEVRIMDLMGRTVHKQNVNIGDRTININLNDSQMAHGQYICTLMIDGKAVDAELISFVE